MKFLLKILIAVVIQVIFFIIAEGISHTFPSLIISPHWVLAFTSGMIVSLVYTEIDEL